MALPSRFPLSFMDLALRSSPFVDFFTYARVNFLHLMKITSAGVTNIGRKRKVNQDAFLMEPGSRLFVVADGMGGHAGGETASKLTVDTVVQSLLQDKNSSLAMEPADLVMGAVHRANTAVYSTAEKNKALTGMGTTVVTMYFDAGKLFVGHVGDSRVYMARQNQLWQVTKDHSLVNEKLKAGLITRDQLKRDKSRNVITRSVGFESSVLVDIYEKEVSAGELYLACSDGLSGMVDDLDMIALIDELAWNTDDLNPLVNAMIDKANAHGGDDNITCVVARVDRA
ncbi:MAG: Stp1/IreP family PP2C-type Ser/Thr phosphatase [Proteobacteria bacterium]|nr:MAG: Stp1/IreP family PP2C-type Ser/Thr phosphatase [Pseudomonadota bacterium]